MDLKLKVKIKWSPKFAYAIDLIATDGNLSIDGRHIIFTSKDLQLVKLFEDCLRREIGIKKKTRSTEKIKKYFYVQFSDVRFYDFLLGLGITPRKSKTIGSIRIPKKFFFDFLRGCFDGDGSFFSYYDPRWPKSFMFYTTFVSASKEFINWLRKNLKKYIGINGHITQDGNNIAYQLKYAKKESIILIPKLYYRKNLPILKKKFLKIVTALRAGGEIGKHATLRGW